jgi:hypothetical protein
MFKKIAIGSVLAISVGGLIVFSYSQPQKVGTVYGCLEKDIPKEAELECRHIREFKHPVMKDGCVYQELHGHVIKTCG